MKTEKNSVHLLHHNTIQSNNFLSQASLDPRLKEYENAILSEIIAEREMHTAQLKKAEAELGTLIADLESYAQKNKNRENELRTHILTLSEKLRIRDIDKLKANMGRLHDEILFSIHEIDDKTRDEIIEKKKDIETRIKLRLMDSEYRYSNVLSEKAKEQEDIMKTLHEYTREMERVKENYNRIKKKVDSLSKENSGYKFLIEDFELKNSKLKFDLTNMKKFINYLRMRVENKKLNKTAVNTRKGSMRMSMSNSKRQSYRDSLNCSRDNMGEVGLGMEAVEHSVIPEQSPDVDINLISEKLNDDEFLQSNPRACGIISSLANILENSKIRLNKLKREIEGQKLNTDLPEKVCEVIRNMKMSTLSRSSNFFTSRSKSHSNVFSNDIYMNKEQRKNFVDSLITNSEILEILNDEKFPNIAIIERKINKFK